MRACPSVELYRSVGGCDVHMHGLRICGWMAGYSCKGRDGAMREGFHSCSSTQAGLGWVALVWLPAWLSLVHRRAVASLGECVTLVQQL